MITAGVLIYSSSYMATSPFFSRFLLLVTLFVLRIWILILRPNFIRILLGWDGLGVTSYLLVIFYQREKSFNAGIITALTNRLGDAGLLVIIGLLLQQGRWSYLFINRLAQNLSPSLLALLIFVAMTKSAQIPFSAWLPAAMAAPTPVSSLVHSSTLVTAGVYLLTRLNYLLCELQFLWALSLLGAITMGIAGVSALFEVDMKKVIALSTLSQLGIMFLTLGIGFPTIAFFHLVSHAYFKAMLFMSAGRVIHRMSDYQDFRAMGGRLRSLPLSLSVITVANLSLCGIPFMAGFFSKDLILEIIIMSHLNIIVYLVAFLATGLTVMYSVRFTRQVFFSAFLGSGNSAISEIDTLIFSGLSVLLGPSVVGGLFISWAVPTQNFLVFLPSWIKLSVLLIVTVRLLLARNLVFKKAPYFLSDFVHIIWFLPLLFSRSSSRSCLNSAKQVFLSGEHGWNLAALRTMRRVYQASGDYTNKGLFANFLIGVVFFLAAFLL